MRKSLFVLACVLSMAGVAAAQDYPTFSVLYPVDGSFVSPDTPYIIEVALDPEVPHDEGEACDIRWRLIGDGIETECSLWVEVGDFAPNSPNSQSFYRSAINCQDEAIMEGDGYPQIPHYKWPWGLIPGKRGPSKIVGNLRLPPGGAFTLEMYTSSQPADGLCEAGLVGPAISFYTTE